MKTRSILFVVLMAMVLGACKRSKNQMLLGSWHATKLENAQMDSFFVRSQLFIDTMGKNGNDATNLAIYGSTNIDSLRKMMQQQFDSVKVAQQGSLLNTAFKFRKDSVAVLSFNGVTDSARWRVEDSMLVMEDLNKETRGDMLHMGILQLDDKIMKLRFQENGSASTVTFEHDAK